MIEGDLLTQTPSENCTSKEFGWLWRRVFSHFIVVKVAGFNKLQSVQSSGWKPSILWIKALKICIFLVLASLAWKRHFTR